MAHMRLALAVATGLALKLASEQKAKDAKAASPRSGTTGHPDEPNPQYQRYSSSWRRVMKSPGASQDARSKSRNFNHREY